ncbi:MAG: septum formation initiator family protein [Firmicutes bacterium]|nr:septum formation initiator family protein [Bacillota bacterium]
MLYTVRDLVEVTALNPKQNRRKSQRTVPGKIQRTAGQKKASNVRVLRPAPKTRTRINYRRVVLVGFAIYFVVWAIYPVTYRIQQKKELDKLNKQLSMIKKQNEKLQKEVDYLNSDEYVEQKARSLGLSRADEEVIVVIPQEADNPKESLKKPSAKAETKKEDKTSPSLWQRIMVFISSVF